MGLGLRLGWGRSLGTQCMRGTFHHITFLNFRFSTQVGTLLRWNTLQCSISKGQVRLQTVHREKSSSSRSVIRVLTSNKIEKWACTASCIVCSCGFSLGTTCLNSSYTRMQPSHRYKHYTRNYHPFNRSQPQPRESANQCVQEPNITGKREKQKNIYLYIYRKE